MFIYQFFHVQQLSPFDPTKKKKKKKVVIQDPSDEVDKLADKTESLAGMYSCNKVGWGFIGISSLTCFLLFLSH